MVSDEKHEGAIPEAGAEFTTRETDAGASPGRCGFAALTGRPNVGKSTLLNQILRTKLAIVSPRPQTTRNRILGIHNQGKDQLILLDTPGLHRRKGQLNRFMVRETLEGLSGVDVILLMTEVKEQRLSAAASGEPLSIHPDDAFVEEQVRQQAGTSRPIFVVINKIDTVRDRRLLLPLIAAFNSRGFSTIIPISALTGDGVDRLVSEVMAVLPVGPRLYPEEMITDRAERFLCAELVREQVFMHCRQEVPYSSAVEVTSWTERTDRGDVRIEAVIHVERDSQKAILIGKGGQMIKTIGAAARQEMARILDCPVHLALLVHVEPEWTSSPSSRRRLGYEDEP